MGDVDDADTVAFDLLDQREKPFGLLVGQRCRRLVEDEHRQFRPECLGNLDHLLLGPAELLDPPAWAQWETKAGDDLLGPPVQRPLVEETAADDLGAEREVLLDGHLRHQRELLEHG